jgi:hypothetical protein
MANRMLLGRTNRPTSSTVIAAFIKLSLLLTNGLANQFQMLSIAVGFTQGNEENTFASLRWRSFKAATIW